MSEYIQIDLGVEQIRGLIAVDTIRDDTLVLQILFQASMDLFGEEPFSEIKQRNEQPNFRGCLLNGMAGDYTDLDLTVEISKPNADDVLRAITEANAKTGFSIDSVEPVADQIREQHPDHDYSESDTWVASFDGASKGNPGPSSVGATLRCNDTIIEKTCSFIGNATNNVAEYRALEAALDLAEEEGINSLTIKGDSQLIINQLTGDWNANNPVDEQRL